MVLSDKEEYVFQWFFLLLPSQANLVYAELCLTEGNKHQQLEF